MVLDISARESEGTSQIRVRPVVLACNKRGWAYPSEEVRTESGKWSIPYLRDLVIRAYVETERCGPPVFGEKVAYEDFPLPIDLKHAEAMVRTLRKIAKGEEQIYEKWGPHGSFGVFCMRIAEILRIEAFIERRDAGMQQLQGTEAISRIDARAADIRRRAGIE